MGAVKQMCRFFAYCRKKAKNGGVPLAGGETGWYTETRMKKRRKVSRSAATAFKTERRKKLCSVPSAENPLKTAQ